MSSATKERAERKARASMFAALADETRLALVGKLAAGSPQSISRLAADSRLTRQAITKHLRVLEEAGIVLSSRAGRESLFQFRPDPMKQLQRYIERISAEWDGALARLKAFVED
jgi:DNA-binding transcriptional ArsR family regulator